jgi:single-strand DNA-binding protein
MSSVNRVILIGNLGHDPELKHGKTSGEAVCRFSLATTEKFDGENKTEWHHVLCFKRLAEIADQYLAKGRQCYVEGRIQTNKWTDKNGVDRQRTEIVANKIELLGKSPDGEARDNRAGPEAPPRPSPLPKSSRPDDRLDPSWGEPAHDDIPF